MYSVRLDSACYIDYLEVVCHMDYQPINLIVIGGVGCGKTNNFWICHSREYEYKGYVMNLLDELRDNYFSFDFSWKGLLEYLFTDKFNYMFCSFENSMKELHNLFQNFILESKDIVKNIITESRDILKNILFESGYAKIDIRSKGQVCQNPSKNEREKTKIGLHSNVITTLCKRCTMYFYGMGRCKRTGIRIEVQNRLPKWTSSKFANKEKMQRQEGTESLIFV